MKAKHRGHFLLDPDLAHLNHGSYGATPLPVLRRQWEWQRRMETRTVEFHVRRLEGWLREARHLIAPYLGASPENLAFVVNSTTGINMVAYSLPLGPGDEVLLNPHEYGAVLRCWSKLARERGFRLIQAPDGPDLLECLESARTPRTRVVVVSHITSPTAQLFPVAAVAAWAQAHNLWTVVDGAHAPGHCPVQLDELGVDFWVGNLHKWLWAPKGAAVLYVAQAVQSLMRPLIVSWGVEPIHSLQDPPWIAQVQMQATRDPSAFLAAPAGLEYQRRYHEPLQERYCWARMEWLSQQLEALGAKGLPWRRPLKMRAFAWPGQGDAAALHAWLVERHRLEVPVYRWQDQLLFRVCLQHYVSDQELTRLLEAVSEAAVAARSL